MIEIPYTAVQKDVKRLFVLVSTDEYATVAKMWLKNSKYFVNYLRGCLNTYFTNKEIRVFSS